MQQLLSAAPLCMPDEYKTEYAYYYGYDIEKSYQRYLALGKEYIKDATAWSKGRLAPDWFYTIRGVKNIQNNQRRNMIGNDDEFMDELANMLTDVIDLKDMPPPSEMQRHLIQVYNTTKDETKRKLFNGFGNRTGSSKKVK